MKIKLKRLDSRGMTHELLIAAFVVVFVVAGVGYLVAGHAQSVSCTDVTIEQGWGGHDKWNCAGHIQYALNAVPKDGSTIHLKVDGQYGPATANAVVYAKKHYGIKPYSGDVTPGTWKKLICPLLRGQVKRHHHDAK